MRRFIIVRWGHFVEPAKLGLELASIIFNSTRGGRSAAPPQRHRKARPCDPAGTSTASGRETELLSSHQATQCSD